VHESPASSKRPFDFADLGRPMPKSVRALPPVPQADASGQLEELSGDDILETDDIDALEAAAAGFTSFEVEAVAPVPAPEPSGFEVGEVGAFDEVEVEGIAIRATELAPEPARIGVVAVIAPAVKAVEAAPVAPVAAAVVEAAPITARVPNHHASTLVGMPAAPVTSPLPLEDREENVIISEPAPQVAGAAKAAPAAPAAPAAERTLEIRGNDMAKVAAAAAQLTDLADSEPQQTEVLVRSAMPPALQQKLNARPSSVAPVALDARQRAPMPVIPPMARVPVPMHMPRAAAVARPSGGLSGLAIGGMAAAALLLVSLVGIGGYAASRTLSKTDAVEATTETTSATGESSPSQAAAAPAAEPTGAASSPIDVSSLPSAPTPGAAPRGFTGKGSFAVTPPPPAPVAAPVAASPVVAAPVAAPVARSSGGALAAPGGNRSSSSDRAAAGAPLPPPASAPAAAAAPVAAAPAATTGVVRVDPNLRAIVVDGAFRRPNDGAVTVACGSHKIKAGMKEAQTVNVPCGGAVSL
jgi:hypothetical protein